MKGVAALAVGTMALVMPLGAQQQGVFRAGVEGVRIDVIVTDDDGPVQGFAGGPYPPELIAEATGGRQFEASAPDLAEQLATRFAELRSSYLITYTPKGVEDVEGFHEVEIRLVGVDGRVQARPGYFTGAGR